MFQQLPLKQRTRDRPFKDLLKGTPVDYRERLESIYRTINQEDSTSFFLNVFTSSPLTQIYNSSFPFGWSDPTQMMIFSNSPYTSPSLINHLSTLKLSQLKNYRYYDLIIKDIKKYLFKAPLISDYSNYFKAPKVEKRFENSKSVPIPVSNENVEIDNELLELATQYDLNRKCSYVQEGLKKLVIYLKYKNIHP